MNTEQGVDSANSVSKGEENDPKKEAQKRTPFSEFKKINSRFKSPLRVPESPKVRPEEEVAELQKKKEQQDSEITQLKEATPFPKFKKVNSRFKSPLRVPESPKVRPEEEVAELQKKKEQLDSEITQLEEEGCRIEELCQHIDKLHEYNDIKDIGQFLLGRIAVLRGTTVRVLYAHFGLELDD